MVTKLRLVFSITILFLSFSGVAQSSYWKSITLKESTKQFSKQRLKVEKAKAFRLDPLEFSKALAAKTDEKLVYFPNEEGREIAFSVSEDPIFSEELARKYPNIQSYKGISLNDPQLQIRFSVSHQGVQSMMTTTGEKGALFMQKTADDRYVLYRRADQEDADLGFVCRTLPNLMGSGESNTAKLVDDQTLRTFRVAVSASGEYTQFHGGTKADALSAINATLTRINAVFERDLAIRLELIGTTDEVIYTNPDTDPYTDNLSAQVQNTLTTVIGSTNYDIGHLFNQEDDVLDGNSGFIGAVCQNNRKGSGYSTLDSPIGDMFDIDLVAHEMGHQFGAQHSFSYRSEGTLVQVEPASGTTIMGYAGITGVDDVATNSDDYFHYVSIVQIQDYLATISCGQTQSLGNTPPVITPSSDYTIPKGTAFVLDAEASDADALNVLSYTWEQIDNGVVTRATFGPTNRTGANFRSLPPSLSPRRYFPKLERVLAGQLTQTAPLIGSAWETVSNVDREFNFSVTVRDNALNGGQSASDEVRVSVNNRAGPFILTSQNTPISYSAGSAQSIVWDVSGTDAAPINAETVSIFLSLDGGLTYPVLLAENTANDGEHTLVIPNEVTTQGRIMVKPTNNIFFAVNTAAITITASEIVLDVDQIDIDVCLPDDTLSIPFTYKTYLGFNEESTFSMPSLPLGLTAVFLPTTATATETAVTIDIAGVSSLAIGTYPLSVVATSATLSKEITLQLNVYEDNFQEVVLTSPLNGATDASKEVVLEWEEALGSTAYDIEIATDGAFNAIVEMASVTTTTYSPRLLENNTDYFWRVKPKNDCGEGTFSVPFSFSTIRFNCLTKNAIGLPSLISSSGTPTITSTVSFLEDLPIADVNVVLDIEHTFLSDLIITLISPAGTRVALVSNSCGDSRNINATFDDEAAPFACGANPAIRGRVQPVNSLSVLYGESALGEWTLEIEDTLPADGGRLNTFSVELCVEGDFRPDADQDGIFDDGEDLCLGTPIGQEVDATGCPIYRFPNDNFRITLQSETCRDNNDGQLLITPNLALDYQVTIIGNGLDLVQNFRNSFNLANLRAGTYALCITGSDGSITYEEFCVDVQISEPEPLSVSSQVALDGTRLTLNLAGAALYTIELNGIASQTEASTVVLDLVKGTNTLKVYTNLPCQGIYEEQIVSITEPFAFPNPVKEVANIFLGTFEELVTILIFTADGRLVNESSHTPLQGTITVDFSPFATGIYYVQYTTGSSRGTLKISKE